MHIQPTPAKSLRAIAIAFLSLASASFGANTPSNLKTPPPGIKLDQKWANAMREGITVMAEIRDLTSSFAEPAANLSAPPGDPIYKGVTYLMPFEEARKVLNLKQTVNSKMLIITPGFPNRSTYAYSFSGNFDGFETLYLVTDTKDQLVAVELLTAHVKKTNLSPRKEKKEWATYDLVNGSTKAITGSKVLHETDSGSGALQIDSVFMAPVRNPNGLPYGYYSRTYLDLEPVSGTRLFLPKPFVQLILYRISQCSVPSAPAPSPRGSDAP